MKSTSLAACLSAVVCILIGPQHVSAKVDCDTASIGKLLPPNSNAVVQSAVPIANNGSYGPLLYAQDPDFPANATGLPALCAIQVNITGASYSHYTFGMFLPEKWNQRLMGAGNTGFGGGIDWVEMGPLVQYGFATISTDTGHLSGPNSAEWANKKPVAQANWGHVALHASIVLAKQLVKGYYGSNATYSYYSACSGGGRQGLKDLQLYPEDFDGVVAGAAPWLLSHLHPWAVYVGLPNLNAKAEDKLTTAEFQFFNNEVMRQCDPQDGHTDKVVSDPYGCKFDWARLQCNGSSTSNCLTAGQISVFKATYTDWTDPSAGNVLVWPSFTLASDASGLAGHTDAPSSFGTEYVENFVLNDTHWDWHTLNASTVALADSLDPGQANAAGYDLNAFRARGGKLLTYHGLADPLIPPASSIYYYEAVLRAMSGGNANDATAAATLDNFFRLFLVPGMHHCSGSNGHAPAYFAGGGQKAPDSADGTYGVPGFRDDPRYDVVLAVMAWVENGTAPDNLTATLWRDGTDAAKGVAAQRPLCKYPERAVYVGPEPDTNPTSWQCRKGSMVGFPNIKIAESKPTANQENQTQPKGQKNGAARLMQTGLGPSRLAWALLAALLSSTASML